MPFPALRAAALALIGLAAVGCGTEIGDECDSDAACGTGRFCDLNSEQGYCTIGGCTANSCPENSICVVFDNEESFCMAACSSGDDCRDGYVCDTDNAAHGFCRVQAECTPESATPEQQERFAECREP